MIERLVASGVDAITAAEIVTQAVLLGAGGSSGHAPSPAPKRSAAAERMRRYRDHRRESGLEPNFNGGKFVDALRARDGGLCVYCSDADGSVVDHMFPISRGGTDAEDNLALACTPCNARKAGKLLSDDGREIACASARSAYVRYVRSHVRADVRDDGPHDVRGAITEPTPSRPSPPDPPNPPIPAQSDIFACDDAPAMTAGKPLRKFLIPTDWKPDITNCAYAAERGMAEEDIRRETVNFRDHFIDRQERRPGWDRSWQRWCRTWSDGTYRRAPGPTSRFEGRAASHDRRTDAMLAGAASAFGTGSRGS